MKTLLHLLLAAGALAFSGCVSVGGNYAAFIQKIPAVTAVDISQSTTTPVYTHSESASGVSTDPYTGILTVTNGKASITIPELGFSNTLTISGLKVQATPEQLATARAIAASASTSPAASPAK